MKGISKRVIIKKKRQMTMVYGSEGEESACNAGDLGLISALGRSPGEGHGSPLQCSGLESPLDRGDWRAAVPGVTEMLSRQDAFSCQPMLAPKAVVAGSYHSSAEKQLWGREITGHAQGCKAGE